MERCPLCVCSNDIRPFTFLLPPIRYRLSLRDLGSEHLPALIQLREEAKRFFAESFNADPDKLHVFCHYPSSARFSTLHFHFVYGALAHFAHKRDRPHQVSYTKIYT